MSEKHPTTPIAAFQRGLKPEPTLTVTQWADTHKILAGEGSKETGRYRSSRTPYLTQPMDDLSTSSPVQVVILMKGAQVGATEVAFNFADYVIDSAPAPMLYVMPTKEDVSHMVRTRFEPTLAATPRLRDKIGARKSRDGANSIFFKQFPGGSIAFIGANSPAGLASKVARYMVFDEVDRYPGSAGGEGNPIEIGKVRTSTYGTQRKIFILSTPTDASGSVIESLFLDTEQNFYHVPCPHCGEFQVLERKNLRWTWGDPDSVLLFCIHCASGIEERHKTNMLKYGKWEAKEPDNFDPIVRGYHIGSLYSPIGWKSWSDIARQVEKCEDRDGNTTDVEKRKVLINTVEGLPYKGEGEAPEWREIYNRRKGYTIGQVQPGVMFLTAGVDVQNDRLEVELVGWGKGKQSWSIEYRVFPGDPATRDPWEMLERYIYGDFEDSEGRKWEIQMTGIDTGGGRTAYVYGWLFAQKSKKIRGLKGDAKCMEIFKAPTAKKITKGGRRVGTGHVWPVGVNLLKDELYSNLRKVPIEGEETGGAPRYPQGYCHFPNYSEEYFKQITAERKVEARDKNGFPVTVWELPSGKKNEALDCRNYARAAASMLGMDHWLPREWESRTRMMRPTAAKSEVKREKKNPFLGDRGDFWGEDKGRDWL